MSPLIHLNHYFLFHIDEFTFPCFCITRFVGSKISIESYQFYKDIIKERVIHLYEKLIIELHIYVPLIFKLSYISIILQYYFLDVNSIIKNNLLHFFFQVTKNFYALQLFLLLNLCYEVINMVFALQIN